MIIDKLSNASRYYNIYAGIDKAFDYLRSSDLLSISPGRYEIDGDNLFAIVQEYQTLDAACEQMEAHKKYIDVQYLISGEELIGHDFLTNQLPTKEYSDIEDYMLFSDRPSFFSKMTTGTFMVFYPTDLHMPCIRVDGSSSVKKVVIKVKIDVLTMGVL